MVIEAALVVVFVLGSVPLVACAACPTMNDIVARADRTENFLLEFARAYGRSAGLADLRDRAVTGAEMELRLWHGFGLTGVAGFVLSRTGEQWKGHIIAPVGRTTCYASHELKADTDWGRAWQRVQDLGLAALPAIPSRSPTNLVGDGYSYVLEWRDVNRYRAFVYDNPDFFKTADDLRMIAIIKQLLSSAGLQIPGTVK